MKKTLVNKLKIGFSLLAITGAITFGAGLMHKNETAIALGVSGFAVGGVTYIAIENSYNDKNRSHYRN